MMRPGRPQRQRYTAAWANDCEHYAGATIPSPNHTPKHRTNKPAASSPRAMPNLTLRAHG
ncbi:hypothetical protein SAMN06298212_11622 [Ruaniaceae bacterium KH17]|nr:hypothetical protein SAMN06298212_11622 [Ruaniaceae bacterium KH17]